MRKILLLFMFIFFATANLAFSLDEPITITSREIVERLTKLEEGQLKLASEIQSVHSEVTILREDMSKQFDRIDSQLNRIDSQFDRLVAIFTAIVIFTLGFAIWDRRTMVRPFETKVKEIDNSVLANKTKLDSVISAFQELSKKDEKVAEILRKFNLL